MKLTFDLRRTGLGNNGGSATIIKSANMLKKLGHEVFIIDSIKNKHTWNKLEVPHLICEKNKEIPNADIIIATGYRSVQTTVDTPKRCGVKFHWIRGWECWHGDDNWINENVLKQPTIKIVNSICLQKKLELFNTKSYIIRPGYDVDELYPLYIRYRTNKFILGGLYTENKLRANRKRTKWVFETYNYLKNKYKNVELWMMGDPQIPHNLITRYFKRPDKVQKNIFYNNIKLWLAPTQIEGLHIPPAEAMLTECPVVGTNAELSGMEDYLIHYKTGFVSNNNLHDFIDCSETLFKSTSLRKEYGINGRNVIKKIGDRETNMKKMIFLFERFL